MARVKKAVFPVAGLGTRFLPATKAVPKELLPVVDKPVLQYAVEEARAAGVEDFIFVSSRGKTAMADHFDRHTELEETLEARGKTDLLEAVRDCAIPSGRAVFVRQPEPLGLGHAVWCAHAAIAPDEPFAVLLPDELLLSDPPCLAQMTQAHEATGGAVLATMEVPRELTNKYGILDPDGDEDERRLTPAKGMVEKPDPEVAPSTMSLIGRYILPGSIMSKLAQGRRGAGGEVQLTDAVDSLIGEMPVHGFRFIGERHDCGSMAGFVKANIACALKRDELREEITSFLNGKLC
ncbi:MAG: UTP--glucose-1-phosphate uridylyltransferase [Pseudomonadota bacterium]